MVNCNHYCSQITIHGAALPDLAADSAVHGTTLPDLAVDIAVHGDALPDLAADIAVHGAALPDLAVDIAQIYTKINHSIEHVEVTSTIFMNMER